MSTSLHIDPPPFPDLRPPDAELESVSSALGLSAEYDTRDSEYQTSSGIYATGVWLVADTAIGSDRDYSRGEARINGYHRLDPKSVLAWRGAVCIAGDDAPFYDICNYGSQNDLRGYASGQYRDRAMVAIQTEYRRHLFGRFGGVVFAGVGGIGPDLGSVTDAFLPAGGVGLRFEASKKYGVNVGVDYAVGKDSSAFYFRIGEAF
jgi:outer membrane protein assembly factor BamA